MDQRQYLDGLGSDAVDKDVIGVHYRLACSRLAAGAMGVGVIGQIVGRVPNGGIEAVGCRFVARADIVEDGQQGRFGLVIPNNGQRH